MKIVKLVSVTFALALLCSTAHGQIGRRIGNAMERAAERAVTRQAERRTEDAVNRAIDDAFDNSNNQQQQQQQSAPANPQQQQQPSSVSPTSPAETPQQDVTMAWNKFDFVSGDEIMFEDYLVGEKLGEFPSQWDIINGNAEISQINGENVIAFVKSAELTPLMKTPKDYLPEIFTVEADFYVHDSNTGEPGYFYFIVKDGDNTVIENQIMLDGRFFGYFRSASNERRDAAEPLKLAAGWHRISISFNKRALKVYFDEQRVVNMPNIAQGRWFSITGGTSMVGGNGSFFIRNVRIAQGAVPLYERMLTDGKFITYGITFDVGKSTIKPESMGEINRIVQLMTENPDLKFSVEGHTDSTGNAASNQTLSEARSQAVVDKLAANGIARDRLTAAGKGQTSPIADNGTDEGRAKNRRVEFVKL